jgi:hypothetical protein
MKEFLLKTIFKPVHKVDPGPAVMYGKLKWMRFKKQHRSFLYVYLWCYYRLIRAPF